MLWCIQPIFKIVTAACLFCRPCSACTRFYKSSLLTADIRGRPFKRLRPKSCRISKSKSSNVPIRPKGLSFCRDVGSSNAPSPGLVAAAAWPKISKISPQTHSLSSASPRFVSCSESFASVNKLFGRTLRRSAACARSVGVLSVSHAIASWWASVLQCPSYHSNRKRPLMARRSSV
jgi:hypothetical protein